MNGKKIERLFFILVLGTLNSFLVGEAQVNLVKFDEQKELSSVSKLKKILKCSFDYLKQKGVQEIKFENEVYYPQIWRKDIKFDNPEYMKCPKFGLGDLDDDVTDLENVLKDLDGFFGYHIEKLGIVLETLGVLLDEGTYFQMPGKRRCPTLSFKQLEQLLEMTVLYCEENKQRSLENDDGH